MAKAESGGIFVSYRRQETSHLAGRLYDRLADRFGEGQVFIDVDPIEPGVDFAEEISRAVAICKVLLAVIGPNWLTAADEQGHRRLDDPDDIVRLEIEDALARDVRVIPILVEGAAMPGQRDLPESLAGLAGFKFKSHAQFVDPPCQFFGFIQLARFAFRPLLFQVLQLTQTSRRHFVRFAPRQQIISGISATHLDNVRLGPEAGHIVC